MKKHYNILTVIIIFLLGFIVFGRLECIQIEYSESYALQLQGALIYSQLFVFCVYGFLGGWLLSGLLAVFTMWIDYLGKKNKKSIVGYILDFFGVIIAGLMCFLPYAIANTKQYGIHIFEDRQNEADLYNIKDNSRQLSIFICFPVIILLLYFSNVYTVIICVVLALLLCGSILLITNKRIPIVISIAFILGMVFACDPEQGLKTNIGKIIYQPLNAVHSDSMEEALLTVDWYGKEQSYRCKNTQTLKVFEGDEYESVFYRSVKDEQEEAVNWVLFRIRYDEKGKKQYKPVYNNGFIVRKDERNVQLPEGLSAGEYIRIEIDMNEIADMNAGESGNRFVFGNTEKKILAEGENIYYLEIEGQKPDEIVEYEVLGETWYFWYYNDLKTDKKADEMEIKFTPQTSYSGTSDVDKQIELFVELKHGWSDVDGEFYLTMADINQDEKWELIVDSIQGTGKFAYNDYFVVDEAGTVLKLDKEDRFGAYLSSYYDSEEGLVGVPVYFDDDNNVYYSIQGTGYQDDPDTFVYSLESLWLKDDTIEGETLAYKICKRSGEEDIVITYKDVQGNELTEAEFEKVAEQKYRGLQKMQMQWKWQKVSAEQIADMSDEQLRDLLINAYVNFKLVTG